MPTKKEQKGKSQDNQTKKLVETLGFPDVNKSMQEIQKMLNEGKNIRDSLVQLMTKKDFLDKVRLSRSQLDVEPGGFDMDAGRGYLLAALFATVWSRVRNERLRIYKDIDELRKFYLANTLISQFATDSLTPEVGTEEILEITTTSKDRKLNDSLKQLQEDYDLDSIVNSIIEDFLAYGEYYLTATVDGRGKKGPGRGLVDLRDDVEQNTVVALTEFGEVWGYLRTIKKGVGQIEKLEFVDKNTYIHFALQPGRLRVDLMREMDPHRDAIKKMEKKYGIKIPRFVRVGKPVLFDVIDKVNELSLLEQLVPAIQLSHMASGNVLGLKVPASMEPSVAMETCRQLEELVNKKVSVDMASKAISIENVMSSAGRLRFIPIWGESTPVVALGYKADETDLTTWANNIRGVVCGAAGIPEEVIFKGLAAGAAKGARADLLRRYARYLRKLKAIQTAIAKAVLQIAGVDLVAKGIPFVAGDIKVHFKNNLIEIDNLDELEYIDTTIEVLKTMIEFMLDKMKDYINPDELMEFVKDELAVAGVPPEIFVKIADQVVQRREPSEPSSPIKLLA